MKVLVTGAKGFVGKNLVAQLNNIKDGKARCYGDLNIDAVYEYDCEGRPTASLPADNPVKIALRGIVDKLAL